MNSLHIIIKLAFLTCLGGHIGWVFAAEEALSPDTVPFVKYVYAIVLSYWGGLAAFLHRFTAGAESARWYTLLLRDTVSSTLAGVLTFMLTLQFSVPPLLSAVAVSVAGYGGSRALEAYYAKAAKKLEDTWK